MALHLPRMVVRIHPEVKFNRSELWLELQYILQGGRVREGEGGGRGREGRE